MQSRALNHGMGLLLKGKKWLGKKVPQRGLGKTQGLGGGRQAEAEKSEFSWEPRHCSVLSHILIHSGLPGSYEVGVSSPSSPVTHEKVRRTGVKTLAQGHTASKCLMVKDERVFFLPLLLLLLFFCGSAFAATLKEPLHNQSHQDLHLCFIPRVSQFPRLHSGL